MVRRNLVILSVLSTIALAVHAQDSKPAAAAEGTDLVVARVAGEPITEKQVATVIEQMAHQKPMLPDQSKQRNVTLFKDALDNLTIITLLKGQARELNLTVDPAVVDRQMQQISKRFPTPEEFQKAMSSQGLSESQLRKNIEESLSLQQVLDRAGKDAPAATDADIQKFYDDNPDKFNVPEQVHAAHILLKVDAKDTPEQKAETKKKLEGIRADIEANKISFADAAAQYSQDPSNAKSGGDLGFFRRGQMVKPFEEAAFSTSPGTLSQVVETQFGYHIVRVLELKPAGKAALDEVKPTIKRYLDQVNKQKATQKYVEDLKSKAKIETFMTAEEFGKRHPVN